TAEIFSPVRPRFLYCTVPPFTTQVWMIEDLDISILYPLSSLLFASNCVIRGFSFLFVLLVLVVPARQPAQEHLRQQWRAGIAHNRQIGVVIDRQRLLDLPSLDIHRQEAAHLLGQRAPHPRGRDVERGGTQVV